LLFRISASLFRRPRSAMYANALLFYRKQRYRVCLGERSSRSSLHWKLGRNGRRSVDMVSVSARVLMHSSLPTHRPVIYFLIYIIHVAHTEKLSLSTHIAEPTRVLANMCNLWPSLLSTRMVAKALIADSGLLWCS